jgi:hypothetical protein
VRAVCSRVGVASVQFGERAVKHLLRQAPRQGIEHELSMIVATGQQLARPRKLGLTRQASAWAIQLAWISGTAWRAGPSSAAKLCTPASMMASACSTAAWRFSPGPSAPRWTRSSTV